MSVVGLDCLRVFPLSLGSIASKQVTSFFGENPMGLTGRYRGLV